MDEGPVVRSSPSATTLYNLRRREGTERPSGPSSVLIVSDPLFDRGGAPSGEATAVSTSRRWTEAGGAAILRA